MGLIYRKVRISNPARLHRAVEIDMLVDSGALYPIVPAALLRQLGLRPLSRERFELADGKRITREVGGAVFEIGGHRPGQCNVIFGRPNDTPVLGALALESMALVVDPATLQLRRMERIPL